MTKLEFLAAFRAACENVRSDVLEAAVADYERQFTDQFLSGQSEQAIVDRWGSPQTAARKLKLSTFNGTLKQPVSAEKVARVGVSGFALLVADLLLVIPACIFACLSFAFYVASLGIYLSGIFIGAASLAQVSYIDVPAEYISNSARIGADSHLKLGGVDLISADVEGVGDASAIPSDPSDPTSRPIRAKKFHVATHVDSHSIWKGLGATVAGMFLLTMCFLSTRLSFRALKRYVLWHFSVLKNA